MRLSKSDFRELMNDPLLHFVDDAGAKAIIARGGKWLDVRLPSEYQNLRIEESINVPLYFIRLKLGTLQQGTPYVVCCDTGRRSAAAAYILVEKGFDAYVLQSFQTEMVRFSSLMILGHFQIVRFPRHHICSLQIRQNWRIYHSYCNSMLHIVLKSFR